MNLSGKVLVITGADGALGRARSVMDSVVKQTGRLDGLINVAGGFRSEKVVPTADFSRWVTLTEAAEVIAFLVSDEASAVTGALIPVVGRV